KMEVQGFGFNPSAGNIVEFIRKSVSSFEDLAEQKRIQLAFQSEVGELFTVFDRDKFEKIIFNLLSNAFKFTLADGKVTVSVRIKSNISENRNKQQLIITISDTGMGVPGEKAGRLFESFYQADSGISSDQGTGLGLSLVKEFVKLHDGDITVESEQGKGTCFTLVFPVKTDKKIPGDEIKAGDDLAPSQSVLPGRLTDDMTGEKATIFIAEDDDDLRFYLKDNLKEQYSIYEAANGNEAAAIIMKILPDLIISDIIMPGLDGIELCRRIKADKSTCHIPVILLTALAREEKQFESLETGADDCITKPFNFQLLEARINNLITNRRNLRKAFKNNIPIEPRDIAITSRDDQFIRKALDLVEENMSKTDYTVEELSQDLGLSRTLLYKKILTLTGKPPHEFIRLLRLKRAAQLLQKSQLNVSEVAFRVGFNDPKYFRKHFKNEFGMLPSAYSEKFSKSS
ncbi:response regulator, partial [bacterium]